jgi:hypothetical protein
MAYRFANIINRSDEKLTSLNYSIVTETVKNTFQNIISYIEHLLESINFPVNINLNSISILSVFKTNKTYSYSQMRQPNSSFYYSTGIDDEHIIANITIDQSSIASLSDTDIYTFYYLPSSIFQYAQNDEDIIIVSPIVGIHVPTTSSRLIRISFFIEKEYHSGRYSCVFWDSHGWNDSGCSHSQDFTSNRHDCFCNHTTSFALIFIPHKTLSEMYIPSIIIAMLSIVCFCISIILSVCRQSTSFRHLSIANIFTLINSIILFILLTAIIIRGYQTSDKKSKDQCSASSQNLAIATYFFLISTFASKTFLGICYFLTIFCHFIFIKFTSMSNKWFYIGFLLVICISIIPIIVIHQWKNLFIQYGGICWFNSSVVFQTVSIPLIILIGLNGLIILGITIRLIKFCIGRKTTQKKDKRMIISMMIWLSLCISLGVAWLFGPMLNLVIKDKEQLTSEVIQWIFGLFIGFEGVWVLIINVMFYLNQKLKKQNREMFLNKFNNRF